MSIFENAKNKANEYLKSEAGERKSDELLDKAAQHATDRLGADKAEHIRKVRDAADDHLGVPNDTDAEASDDPQYDENAQ
ncbi:antitoxin [Corynebacterium nasicanis]|uniref:Antitoxin n=1 Tax=Corynebacterium nasicanis TaxID=1448267 RepID=A0ABW1QFQ6_9CORY